MPAFADVLLLMIQLESWVAIYIVLQQVWFSGPNWFQGIGTRYLNDQDGLKARCNTLLCLSNR